MRVTFLLLNIQPTGGARVTLQHLSALVDAGHDVAVALPEGAGHRYLGLPPGLRIISVPVRRGGYASVVLALAAATPSSDLVVANSWQMVLPAMLARLRGRTRHVVHLVQGFELFADAGRSRLVAGRNSLLRNVALRLPTRKIAVSSWVRNRLRNEYGYDAVVVPNGVDTGTFHRRGDSRMPTGRSGILDILAMGRSEPSKGLKDLLAAVRLLGRQNVPVRLTVATQDAIALPADIHASVVKPAGDRELAALCSSCDVFAFTSWSEGFGLPPLEAMACGAAVVTTDCGGVTDFAIDGENCLVVPPRRPDELAAAIVRLHADPGLRQRLGRAGIETAGRFTIQKSTARMIDVLTDIAGNCGVGTGAEGM